MKYNMLRALMIGNSLEYYDFFLYNFFVSILSPLFFPLSDPLTVLMMGFSVFWVGFVSRPIGALFFGHIGDKYGRKKALLITLILMAFSTVGIGLLPSYEIVGIFAPLFLVFFRLLQGFAAGGEVSGAVVLGLEQTETTRHGLIGSLINSSAGIGAIMATSVGLLFTSSMMPDWGWRIPFCLGGMVGFVGVYLRRSLKEVEQKKFLKTPLLEIIQNHPRSFIKAIGVGGFLHVPFYIIVGYMNPTLHINGLINSSELMLMNMVVTLIGVLTMPVLGYFSDKIGPDRLMVWSALGQMFFVFPVFLSYSEGNLSEIFLMQIGLLVIAEAFIAPSNAYLNTLFPIECRYSGIAFGTCLGVAIFGGTTPLICSQLASSIGPVLGPSLYLVGTAFLGIFAARKANEKDAMSLSLNPHSV